MGIFDFIKDIFKSKRLIFDLSKSDFKTKYAGSYLGIVWAFAQPIVTILVFWFVFQVGFRSAPVENVPFVLWLVCGMIPWFFFSEALLNATNSLLEYSYLVKKMVFKVSILPVVKIISSLFVHIFFIFFIIFMFLLYGYKPSLINIQAIYYSFCAIFLILGISFITSSLIVFFRDLSQIISIFLQFGMWLTPIMWSYTRISASKQWILKLNPMYYIVEGYRDSFINHVWFWEKYKETCYFWVLALSIFLLGIMLFKRMKPHFSDVL